MGLTGPYWKVPAVLNMVLRGIYSVQTREVLALVDGR